MTQTEQVIAALDREVTKLEVRVPRRQAEVADVAILTTDTPRALPSFPPGAEETQP